MSYDYLNHISKLLKNYTPHDNKLAHFVGANEKLITHLEKYGFNNDNANKKFMNGMQQGGAEEIDEDLVRENIGVLADVLSQNLTKSSPKTCHEKIYSKIGVALGENIIDINSNIETVTEKLAMITHIYYSTYDVIKKNMVSLSTESISIGDNNFLYKLDENNIEIQKKVFNDSVVVCSKSLDNITDNVQLYHKMHNTESNTLIIANPQTEKALELLTSYIYTLHTLVSDNNLANLRHQLTTMKHLLNNNVPPPTIV